MLFILGNGIFSSGNGMTIVGHINYKLLITNYHLDRGRCFHSKEPRNL